MKDVVETKTFRNGGSIAIRIPAGWVHDGEVTLSRNPNTGEISVSQRAVKLARLLEQFAAADSYHDEVFESALVREQIADQRSIFELQDEDAAN